MTCVYCRTMNADDDRRCSRCGRRLHTPQFSGAAGYHTRAATALRLEPPPDTISEAEPPRRDRGVRRPMYQRHLFPSTEMPQVIPIEPTNPSPRARQRGQSEPQRPRVRKPIPGQQMLDFAQVSAIEPAIAPDTVIDCDACVAVRTHRTIAAAMDASMVLLAFCTFCAVFRLVTGQIALTKPAMIGYFAVAALFMLIYKTLWCLANNDSPGMRWAHLRLVNFDGQKPARRFRFYRMASGVLSVLAAGLGVAWALVDEESLTWHDHISKTFPTPY